MLSLPSDGHVHRLETATTTDPRGRDITGGVVNSLPSGDVPSGLSADHGFDLVHLGSVSSTNSEAASLAEAGATDRTMVVATEQLAGQGRGGRVWQSPFGNLYTSTVLRPACAAAAAANLGFVAALAVSDLAKELVPGSPAIVCKWPNDVLVDGRKIAGILLQSALDPDARVRWLIIGVGINVTWAPDSDVAAYPAAALASWSPVITVESALSAYARRLDFWLKRWEQDGFAAIRPAWLARAHGYGTRLTVRLPHEAFEGSFRDLDADGALVVETASGLRRVHAADVFPITV